MSTLTAIAMIFAATFALFAGSHTAFVARAAQVNDEITTHYYALPADSGYAVPVCHGEAVWERGGHFHACRVP